MPLSSFILHPSSLRLRRGFTLTELMISVALALILLVGINQVFKTTSATVGTSYASLDGARKQLALDNVLTNDFSKIVPTSDQPAIIIHSEAIPQYWDANDANTDTDNNVYTVDLDDDKAYTSAGENIDVTGMGATGAADLRSGRSHRVDRVSFFARDKNHPFTRQTGDIRRTSPTADVTDRLMADEASSEAWISYGFLRMPANGSNLSPLGAPNGDYYAPAQIDTTTSAPFLPTKNQNNYYVRDWALGRQCMLLSSQPVGDYLAAGTAPLAPLDPSTKAFSTTLNGYVNNPVTGSPWLAAHSRYDIAQTTIRDYRKLLQTRGSSINWYASLDYQFNGKPWADHTVTAANGQTSELATTSTFLSRGVSQFIVEFAGDFCKQDNDPTSATYGNVLSTQPDGIVDFVVEPVTLIRKTRWYGFPRDVSGPSGVPDGLINRQYDVVPVRDFIGASSTPNFEVVYPTGSVQTGNYPALPRGAQYICAWGPGELATSSTAPSSPLIGINNTTSPQVTPGPWMIRIVVNVRDPNGRLPEGQQLEYVYTLKQ